MARLRPFQLAALTSVLLACAAADARPSTPAESTSGGDFRWQKSLDASRRVEIHDKNGGLRLEPSSGDVIEILATKTGRASDFSLVNVVVKEVNDAIVVCVTWPGDGECGPGGPSTNVRSRDSVDVKVDLVARLPAKVTALTARTMNGSIRAEGLSCPSILHTMNGPVEVTAAAPVDAVTMNGHVAARVSGKGHRVRLQTSNGRVELTLPADADADIEASTMRGHLRSAFGPVPAPPFPGISSSARLRVGAGGTPVTLKTMKGDVLIHRG